MELLEAIKSRKSIRAYKPDPVPKKVLTELLEVARWAPSGTNTQPWEFFVLTGKVLDDLNHAIIAKIRSGDAKPNPDIDVFETPSKGTYSKRQQKFIKQILDLVEPVEGKNKMQNWFERSVSNYGAPARIVIVADKSAAGWFIFDIGIVTQTIVLAAQEYGLGTCILSDTAAYPAEVRRIVGISESKLIIIGIAIGYPDWDDPLNRLRTGREPVEELVACDLITKKDGTYRNTAIAQEFLVEGSPTYIGEFFTIFTQISLYAGYNDLPKLVLLDKNPQLRVTICDLQEVVELAKEVISIKTHRRTE